MSLAIATASREAMPSSISGADSLTESGEVFVALATQLRIHSRSSGTETWVRGSGRSSAGDCELSCASVMFTVLTVHLRRQAGLDNGPGIARSVGLIGVVVGHLAAAQAAVEVAGAARTAADLAAGGPRDRACRGEEHVANGDTVSHGDRGPDVVGDRLLVELVCTGGALADDDQLLGGVVRVELQARVRTLEDLARQLVGRHRECGDVADAQCLAGLLRGVLQVLGIVVASVDDHQILDAAGDVQIAIVEGTVVAGAHPQAVVRNAVGVRRLDPRLQDVL